MKMKNFVSLFPCSGHLLAPSASPFMHLPNINALCAAMFLEEMLRSGLAHVVLCPGSRCAPLTVAVARSGCAHTLANDERGAGFIALGFARASGRCAAVVVSSGTAVANLLPAVVEAAQDRVPILLLTADRPAELRDTGANQTIPQAGIFDSRFLRWFKDVPCATEDMALEPLLSDASYAMARAAGSPCGPVHMNMMFREPLAPVVQPWPRELLTRSKRVTRWLYSSQPFTSYPRPYQGLLQQPDAQLLPLLGMLRGAQRGVIVAGSLFTAAQQHAATALASRLGWPLLADVCSGLRRHYPSCGVAAAAPIVPLIDILLSAPKLADTLAIDVVLQIGGRLVGKRLQALVSSSSVAHILVEEHGERMDPDCSVTHRLQGDIAALLGSMLNGLKGQPLPRNPLLNLCNASREADSALQTAFHESTELSEPWVAWHICNVMTSEALDDEVLFSSNSLPIRHLDTFCACTPLVLCNRGASGIDGILHTAIGAALGSSRCVLLVGDLAMLHDLNALASLQRTPAQLIVIVLNNRGGGIFQMLPIAKHEDIFTPYFDTPHELDFAQCCRGFGLPHVFTATKAEFEAAFQHARQACGPYVIEVPTDQQQGRDAMSALRAATHEVAIRHGAALLHSSSQ